MKVKKGHPLPLGVSEKEGFINFSVAVQSGEKCILKLYKRGEDEPQFEIELTEEDAVGEVRAVAFQKSNVRGLEYNYEIAGASFVDPYAKSVVEREGAPARGRVSVESYDWEDDRTLQIPDHEVIAYSLHVRGFTRHGSSKVKKKGTFQGLVEKIPYLQELGINQIQCMPVYSFAESEEYKNYWGYGPALCFAVKSTYAAGKNPEKDLKDMVKACHKAGIEVVLNLPFTEETPKHMIEECLRYYVTDYHVDGFVVNPYVAPMANIWGDPILKKTKILQNRDDFQNAMRCFLKGDEGMIESVIWWLRQQSKSTGSYNYITNQLGFTLQDLVSYDEKHNELNGEDNKDGPDYNCSWNCGIEGKTRRKYVLELRKKQVRNAFFLLLSAQGTPCILAGDEFGNSQNGNNNVYCQDNEISWLNWKDLEKNQELFQYVKKIIQLRKNYSFLHSAEPLSGTDLTSSGVPDVSYHGKFAWQVETERESKQLGIYYHNAIGDVRDCFIAYNMSWRKLEFALPKLQKGKQWYRIFSTEEATVDLKEVLEENQKETEIDGRTIVMFIGR